jgi:dipeptide/tripeptide permease
VRVLPGRQTRTAGFLTVYLRAYRNAGGFEPLVNIVATLGLPLLAMLAFVVTAFSHQVTPVVRSIGWIGLVSVGLWYALVVITSLMRKMELPDTFWREAKNCSETEINAARSVSPILFVMALIPVFWSLFDQTNSTWVLQGGKMLESDWFGFKITAERMQSANPALVMILVPLLTLGVYPRLGRLASPLRRMSFGMFLAALSYVIVAALQARIDSGGQLSLLWQIVPYVVLTTAEVLVSTTGLEFAFREAAPQMKSTVMSFWLLTVAFGNLLVTGITKVFSHEGAGAHEASVSAPRFMLYAGLTFVVAILFSVVAAFYRYRDKAAAEGK